MVVTLKNNPNSDLFILPLNDKLIQIGSFALRCTLNEGHIKLREKYNKKEQSVLEKQNFEIKFEENFKRIIENRTLKMRISQLVTVKAELEAMVELFYLAEDGEILAETIRLTDKTDYSLIVAKTEPSHNLDTYFLKLNCVYHIIRKIQSEDHSLSKMKNLLEEVFSFNIIIIVTISKKDSLNLIRIIGKEQYKNFINLILKIYDKI